MGQLTGFFLSVLVNFCFYSFPLFHFRFENYRAMLYFIPNCTSDLAMLRASAAGGWSSFDGRDGGRNALEGNLRDGCHDFEQRGAGFHIEKTTKAAARK